MLFLKYLWSETIFKMFIPIAILMPFSLYQLLALNVQQPWLTIPVILVFGGFVIFGIESGILALCKKIYRKTWETGYVKWKKEQSLPPNDGQKELKKVIQILQRHIIEYKVKKKNPAALQIWNEYQLVLALTDGIETVEDIELNRWFEHCLKGYDDLR